MLQISRMEPIHTARNLEMNLVIWIPGLIVLGLVTLGLMFAFVTACDHV
jgi:hypothetical protein